jgi:hypothetical protein
MTGIESSLQQASPYLTVVATARNDNHGGDLLHRMQVFVNGLAAQCARFGLPTELILVEWNPPEDRERLARALNWPPDDAVLKVRIVEVAPGLHAKYSHAERLPLFQMIAKNVGIRRARGQFVLATNVDVLFSDDLMRVISQRSLREGRLYRADRHDVDAQLDPDAPVVQQLSMCSTHVIRICGARGTSDIRTNEYFPIYGSMSHWPGPLGRWSRLVRFGIPFVLRRLPRMMRRAGRRFMHDLRRLGRDLAELVRITLRTTARRLRSTPVRTGGKRLATRTTARNQLRQIVAGLAAEASALRAVVRMTRDEVRVRSQQLRVLWEQEKARVPLHTNACGDFTLMSRSDWFRLRGYAELQMFSMHLDSLLLYEAHYSGVRQVVLRGPVYHLEHGGGFKPDSVGLKQLNDRLDRDAIPQVTNEQFSLWAIEMFRERRPKAFNDGDWGLANERLTECEAGAGGRRVRSTVEEVV